ncbi:hypothetical protein [Pandoraea iniqua]|nr:hypothetical protein [Pandoraea iniqua]
MQQLAIMMKEAQSNALAPIDGLWECLLRLTQAIQRLPDERRAHFETKLSTMLATPPLETPDAVLLRAVIQDILGPARASLENCLAHRAHDALCLPNLQLRAPDEVEPNARTFNSVLPSFAACTYDYGPLGRTLLWCGACLLFEGPSQVTRREKLRQTIFSFPNPPQTGEAGFENIWEFVVAVDKLAIDEPVDINCMQSHQIANTGHETCDIQLVARDPVIRP